MNFERDVFISYAHIDNLSLKEGEKGWVANLHRALEVRLSQLMGEEPEIWRDQKLQGNDFFDEEIAKQITKTALMISILSPPYIKSEWCTRELREFIETSAEGIGLKIGNKSRIFKLIKTAVPYEAHPPEIADILGYEFFIIDSYTNRIKELSQKSGGELEQIYWTRLDDLAHDIRDLLETVKYKDLTNNRCQEDQLSIYLAGTSFELKEQRDMIKRELMEWGYRILPDRRVPLVEPEYKKSVEELLDQCVLSIHLVGGSYGAVPEGSQTSIVALQNELAIKKSKTGELQRLIWLLPGSNIDMEDERQKQFIHQVRADIETQYGADLFETPIEEFKYAIRDRLEHIKSAPASAVVSIKEKPLKYQYVYLAETNYYLEKQRDNIKRQLMEQGYKVLPDQPLPLVYSELTKTIDSLVERCDISIHLLGEDYGVVPDKTEKSILCIQNERAAERSRGGQLKRLIWLPPTVNQKDERQRSFIQRVKANAADQPNDDIFATPLEDMEATIFNKLEILEKEASTRVEPITRPLQIYLICDQKDLNNITELEDFLYYSEFDYILPAFDGEEAELMHDHHENLKCCDAAVIYYGAGNDLWMHSITRDLKKIAGYGRTRPLEVKAVYLAPPLTPPKEHFRSHGILTINGMQGFSPGLMEPFMEMVKAISKG